MLIYIWIRFEWQFSLGAIVALFHDVIITLGIFSLFSLEINLSIVAAVLTIVGYSMNDTVVIFDRVRENLKKYADIKIFELTNISINETLSRTIITSITTLLALLSIYLFGGEILKGFSLAMILGVIFGTYSSIYIANPILVMLKVSQRTIITSITTLLALLSIYFFGGEILKGFSLAMILGVIFGTYSSIYIANPILVALNVSQKTIIKEDKD